MKNIKMTFLKTKKKKIIFIIILFLLSGGIYLSIIISDLVRYGYDRQSKIIETVKKVIPRHYVKKIKDNIFVISNLKAKNDTLELQLRKYEQGYEGQKLMDSFGDLQLALAKYNLSYDDELLLAHFKNNLIHSLSD